MVGEADDLFPTCFSVSPKGQSIWKPQPTPPWSR